MTTTKIPEGSFLVEEDSAYHDIAKKGWAISASALKVFRQSPRDYQAQYLRGEVKRSESPALVIGRAAHALILEGVEVFEKSFVMIEDLDEEFGFINPKTRRRLGKKPRRSSTRSIRGRRSSRERSGKTVRGWRLRSDPSRKRSRC
jgi:hypothetical protein